MRAVLIWAVAIALIGAIVVIATDPLKDRGPDLSSALLNTNHLGGSWATSGLGAGRAEQMLITPCSGQPVLSGAEWDGYAGRHFAQTPMAGPFIEHLVVLTSSPATAASAVAAIQSEAGAACPSGSAFTLVESVGLGGNAVALHRSHTDNAYGSVDEIKVFSSSGANIVLVRQIATRGEVADPNQTLAYAAVATELARPTGEAPPPSRSTLVGSQAMQLASYLDRLNEHRSSIIRGATFAGLLATLAVMALFIISRIRAYLRQRAALRAMSPNRRHSRVPRRRVPVPIVENSTLDISQKLLKIKEMNRRDSDHDTASVRAVKLQQQMLIEAGIIDRLNAESGPVARG